MIPICYSPKVQKARDNGTPIVALESTIITHGMPYPYNLKMVREVESIIEDNGACPATIAVLNGTLHIGLSDDQAEDLAQYKDAAKLSRADLAVAMARGQTGATTVAATMIGAHVAGIEVFATGGIGGVHRGAEASFDISADLHELAKTPVTVVCAGAKAILDIPKTLEVLETLGVPVLSLGQDAFAGFWAADSGYAAPLRVETIDEIAAMHVMRRALGLEGGHLVANPIPAAFDISMSVIGPIIEQAIQDAEQNGIRGKKVTPYLLGRILELTEGRSLASNIALVKNNAQIAAKIAIEIQKQRLAVEADDA